MGLVHLLIVVKIVIGVAVPLHVMIILLVLMVVVMSVCCGYLISRRLRNSSDEYRDYNEPLLSDIGQDIFGSNKERIGGVGYEANMGPWMCIICGYDNKARSKDCPMCGTSRDFSMEYKTQKMERD